MSDRYEPRLRPERLIAGGRVALASASLFAVWFDPDEPVRFVALTYIVLAAYLVSALAVAFTLWRAATISRRWTVAAHAMDLACCALLIFCTEGPASPFTSFFVFALLSATLRWRTRGVLWTAGIVIVAHVASGLYFATLTNPPELDMRTLIIRGVYLLVLAVLLQHVGAQDQRTAREMWGLAKWPHYQPRDIETLTRTLLQYAAGLLDAPRLTLRWSESGDEQSLRATWSRGGWTFGPGAPDHDEPIHPMTPSPLVTPLRGETCHGHLHVHKADITIDDRVLAEVVADVIAGRIDSHYLSERLRTSAATDERIRLARDLHDGVLQSFTGVALRLAAIQRLLSADREAAMSAVEDVQRVLASEQRSLRFFIQELRPASEVDLDTSSLRSRLSELTRLIELEWDLQVDLHIETDDDAMSAVLSREIYHVVREGLINAARHGRASQARVSLRPASGSIISVEIADNGCGFPVTGHFSSEDMAHDQFGPKSLRERVSAMRGTLMLDSGPDGATLTMTLPQDRVA